MSDVRLVTLDDGRLAAVTPYHAGFVAGAKEIGGRWTPAAKAWTFDPRDEQRVRDLLREHFGTDGSPVDDSDLVTVRTRLYRHEDKAKAVFAGRRIAYRPSRDGNVLLAKNVILVAGKLKSRGGSNANPRIAADMDVIVEIRDIPRASLDVEDAGDYEIVERRIDTEALRAERDRLLERLSEINAALSAAGELVSGEEKS